jgi:predicted GNAT family N-acyltransferase
MSLLIEILAKKHNKRTFDCGQSLLDNYILKQAGQDVRRRLSVCYVLIDSEDNAVKGYYTLSSNAINRDTFPEQLSRKLPPGYEDIPTILLGRLAIDNSLKGKGFGAILLLDALKQCVSISETVGALAVVVDPIDENAQRFYEKYGFILLPGSRKMFLPMKTIRKLFE